MIRDWEFKLYFNGREWVAHGKHGDLWAVGLGSTPVSAMIDAEVEARKATRETECAT